MKHLHSFHVLSLSILTFSAIFISTNAKEVPLGKGSQFTSPNEMLTRSSKSDSCSSDKGDRSCRDESCCRKLQKKTIELQEKLNECCAAQGDCCRILQAGIMRIENKINTCCGTTDNCCDSLKNEIECLQKQLKDCCKSQDRCCLLMENEFSNVETKINKCCDSSDNSCKALRDDIAQVEQRLNECCNAQTSCCSLIQAGICTIENRIDACCSTTDNCCETLQCDLAKLKVKLNEIATAQKDCCRNLQAGINCIEQKISQCCGTTNNCCDMLEREINKIHHRLAQCCDAQADCCKALECGLRALEKRIDDCCSTTDNCCKNLQDEIECLNKRLKECCNAQTKCCSLLQMGICSIENKIDTCCNNSTNCCAAIQAELRELNKTLTNCCNSQLDCCNKIKADISKILSDLNMLIKTVTDCCNNQVLCCSQIRNDIAQLNTSIAFLQTTLENCCKDQRDCCREIKNILQTILTQILNCCNGGGGGGNSCETCIPILSIPCEGLVLDVPGHYVVKADLFFDGCPAGINRKPALNKQTCRKRVNGEISSVPTQTPGLSALFGIVVTAINVTVTIDNHLYQIEGENIGAIALLESALKSLIEGGIIRGNNAVGQYGILVATSAATVSNATVASIAAAPAAAAAAASAAPASAAAAAAAAAAAPAAAAAVAVASAAAASATSLQLDPPNNPNFAIIIEDSNIFDSLNGINLGPNVTNVIIRDVSINRAINMGIIQPARSGFHGNILFENVLIANSGKNGIYSTFNQDNWIFKHCQIRNSGLNGAIFEGTQNLKFINSQISQSGAKGLVASIRQSQNIELSGLEIFEAGDECLRVDNVQSLTIRDSKFTNYTSTTHPVAKIQDVNNGTLIGNQFMSAGGIADGLFIRNSHGLLIENNVIKVFNNFTSNTPTPLPPAVRPTTNTNNSISNSNSQATSNNDSVSAAKDISLRIAAFIQQHLCPPNPPTPPTPPIPPFNPATIRSPIGINLQGGVTATRLVKNIVSGTPTVGIALLTDALNGFDEGITIDYCVVDGAERAGIALASALNCTVLRTEVINGQGDGILIDNASNQSAVRENTLTNNRGLGIRNFGFNSQIYRNFASGNGQNYTANILQTAPAAGVGSLENISG